jgi:hypothetical protein
MLKNQVNPGGNQEIFSTHCDFWIPAAATTPPPFAPSFVNFP